MRVASIDDIVEQEIHNAISGMARLAGYIRSQPGVVAMRCRRTSAVIALIAFGFLFRLEFLLGMAIAPLAVWAVASCIKRAVKVGRTHSAHADLPIAQTSVNGRGTAPGLHDMIQR